MRNPLSKLTTFFCIVMFVVLASACGGPSSTPTQTLTDYCSGLKNADYQTAYNQFSNGIRELSESQYAALLKLYGKVTNCTLRNVDDSAGTGTVTITASNGLVSSQNYALTQENGTWKISALTSIATETLNNFCSALMSEDYQSAFSDLSSTAQSQVGSADQFASSFSSNKVKDCTVSNADDSAGTGIISYTYADGSTQVFNYTLVNQNNDWLIDSAQQAQ